MQKRCLWCLEAEPLVSFSKKAHTIPMSLGGQNYNNNVCDSCNEYFGVQKEGNIFSIEEALKETFNISRRRFLTGFQPKRQVGRFKSKFFEIKERKGKYRLVIKPSFKFNPIFQKNLCRSFKRGLYKMFFEELNRQEGEGFEEKYNFIRKFARYNELDFPVFYFQRSVGLIALTKREAETPFLMFGRMKYLYSDSIFVEIEFLGHVFGFPKQNFTLDDFQTYHTKSMELKTNFFSGMIPIEKLTDIDFTLTILND
ncbi:MAG: hypothetical protein KDD29_04350 [Flavobacteriales bacterium]|nr:hypothetical protein [Flavobacteriales bacterium]MCB9335755.1 hypothetical protein [Flavobacteriales bacterium]